MKVTVRIIRTYEVDVDAEYGDTEFDLKERALKSLVEVDHDSEYSETAVILPQED